MQTLASAQRVVAAPRAQGGRQAHRQPQQLTTFTGLRRTGVVDAVGGASSKRETLHAAVQQRSRRCVAGGGLGGVRDRWGGGWGARCGGGGRAPDGPPQPHPPLVPSRPAAPANASPLPPPTRIAERAGGRALPRA